MYRAAHNCQHVHKAGPSGTPESQSYTIAQRVLQAIVPRFSGSITRGVNRFKQNVDPRELQRLIEDRKFEELEIQLGEAGLASDLEGLASEYEGAIALTGQEQKRFFLNTLSASIGVKVTDVDFDPVSRRAQRFIRERTGNIVRAISITQRQAIRTAIQEGLAQGIPPRKTARLIADSVGLAPNQVQAVSRFRGALERGVPISRFTRAQRGILRAGDKEQLAALDPERIDALVDNYAQASIKNRSKMIARTEMQTAVNFAEQEQWRQARDQGLIDQTARKTWVVAGDERTCPICLPLSGRTIALDESFLVLATAQSVEQPPAHPSCRCYVKLTLREDG